MRKEKEVLDLQCVLTDNEKLEYAKQMSEALHKQKQAEQQKSEFVKQIGADISKYEARCHELSHKISTGKEFRDVECRIIYDWEKKTKTWIRLDTGEIAKDDIIPEYELQEELALQEPKKEEKKQEPEKLPPELEQKIVPMKTKKSKK